MRNMPEVGIPPFSLVLASPSSALGGTSLPYGDLKRTSSPLATLASNLLKTPIMDYSDVSDEGIPTTPLGSTNIVVLSDSPCLCESNLPEAATNSGVYSKMLPSSGVLLVASSSVKMASSQ